MILRYLMLAAASVLLSVYASAKTLYVSPSGDDDNAGTSRNAPLKTIQRASGKAAPGDLVLILPGTYRNQSASLWDEVFVERSGSAGEYITFRGERDARGNRPVLLSASASAITFLDKSYVIVEGLEMRPTEDDPKGLKDPNTPQNFDQRTGVRILGGCHHIVIRDCYLRDFPGGGMGAGGADYIWFDGNVVEHCGVGSSFQTSGFSVFNPKNVAGTSGDFPEYPGYGIVFSNNVSRYNVNLQGAISDGNGFIIDQTLDVNPAVGLIDLEGKSGQNARDLAFGLADDPYTRRSLVTGNVAYGNGAPGINVFASTGVDVFHNVCFDNGQSREVPHPRASEGTEVIASNREVQVGGSFDVRVRDNVFYGTDDETFANRSTFWVPTDGVEWGNNLHWNLAGGVDEPLPASSVNADPRLTSLTPLTRAQIELLATGTAPYDRESPSAQVRTPTVNNGFPVQDVTPTENSPAVDAGSVSDFWEPRGNAPDIGAVETPFSRQPPPRPSGTVIGEAGRSRNGERWNKVELGRTYDSPIVVLGPLSYSDPNPATTRVRNVTATSFEWRIDPWEYLDATTPVEEFHDVEEVSFVVVEEGVYALPNGAVLQASKSTTNSGYRSQSVDRALWTSPIVFSEVVTENEAQAVSVQLDDVRYGSFRHRLREEENGGTEDGQRGHGPEQLHWIASTPGVNNGEGTEQFEIAAGGEDDIDTPWRTYGFQNAYTSRQRIALADVQTTNGGDPWTLRLNLDLATDNSSFTQTTFELFAQEETSRDAETAHLRERVGFMIVGGTGPFAAEEVITRGPSLDSRSGGDVDLAGVAGLSVLGNPVRDGELDVVLGGKLATAERLEVRLTDLRGSSVYAATFAGAEQLLLGLPDVASGVYVLTVSSARATESTQVAVGR